MKFYLMVSPALSLNMGSSDLRTSFEDHSKVIFRVPCSSTDSSKREGFAGATLHITKSLCAIDRKFSGAQSPLRVRGAFPLVTSVLRPHSAVRGRHSPGLGSAKVRQQNIKSTTWIVMSNISDILRK
ncbi:hypothetical protein Y032_0067g42 [Ancylostoma ceylanicum]|uniref:Uncharacterized protein n=2 Tax=Ancylostoma ceylanicum TaxID=53326 RepID=A0A016TYR9_9BILA|nr:hypothetical protein Y032_0067g42 [Ancylostoma ceylanicum]